MFNNGKKTTARAVSTGVLAVALGLFAASVTAVSTTPAPAQAAGAGFNCQIEPPNSQFSADVAASAKHARIWRLYQAYFLRQPDNGGLDYWLSVYDSGYTLTDLALYFELSEEFSNTYGQLNNTEFLELIYNNVLCRNPDGQGFNYWLDFLNTSQLSRSEMLVYFSESEEYMDFTSTGWSVFASADEATISTHGFEIQSLPGGQMVAVDLDQVEFKASGSRCEVASINGNWFINKDKPNTIPIGLAVIDDQEIPWVIEAGVGERGVLGKRKRPQGPIAEEEFIGTKLNSNLHVFDGTVLESWYGFWPDPNAGKGAWDSGLTWGPSPARIANDYEWAAAGIPLITNGQTWSGLSAVANQYTHQRGGHSFVAMDTDGLLYFGSVAGKTSTELVAWAESRGFEDLIKFDGGGSVEFNVGGAARVGGTPRNVPLWLGIGC